MDSGRFEVCIRGHTSAGSMCSFSSLRILPQGLGDIGCMLTSSRNGISIRAFSSGLSSTKNG